MVQSSMNIASHREFEIINHILKNGIILTCNNYKHHTKQDIMNYAISLSHILKAKGVVTVGWNGENPQLYLNIE